MAKEYNKIEVKDNMNVENTEEAQETNERKEPLKKVITAEPKKVKRGLINRLVNGVLGPEGLPSIGTYIAEDIIKPAIKNLIVESVTSGVNKLMYRDGGGPLNRGGQGYNRHPQQYTNYTNRYAGQQPQHPNSQPNQQPNDNRVRAARYGVDEYIITDRYDAAHVLTQLTDNANNYGTVSVADYYDLIGVATVFTDNNYGWSYNSISRATIMPIRNGYVIKFPSVEVI